jgi:ribonuclease-3
VKRRAALERLEAALGHRFRRRELLEEALRHSSAAHERAAPSSQRLEFVGDAALSHAVALLLFERWPDSPEGELTRARSVLVRSGTLAGIAERLGVGDALELGSGVRERAGAPVLADAFEAVLGALLLDAGWRSFRAVVARLLREQVRQLDPSRLPWEEPKSTLQERAQAAGLPLPVYREVEVRGPAHRRAYVFEVVFDGRVLATGEGHSKRAAQQEAARRALEALGP